MGMLSWNSTSSLEQRHWGGKVCPELDTESFQSFPKLQRPLEKGHCQRGFRHPVQGGFGVLGSVSCTPGLSKNSQKHSTNSSPQLPFQRFTRERTVGILPWISTGQELSCSWAGAPRPRGPPLTSSRSWARHRCRVFPPCAAGNEPSGGNSWNKPSRSRGGSSGGCGAGKGGPAGTRGLPPPPARPPAPWPLAGGQF